MVDLTAIQESLQSQLAATQTLVNQLQAVEANVNQAEANIATLQTDLSQAQSEIANLQTNVTTVQTSSYAALEPYIRVEATKTLGVATPKVFIEGINVILRNGSGNTNWTSPVRLARRQRMEPASAKNSGSFFMGA